MAATAMKIKAILLILLLAGSEAARLHAVANVTIRTRSVEETMKDGVPADKQWQQVNRAHCSWRTWSGGCTGKGCSYRPLPLDRSQSDSCRLSNDYMLHGDDSQSYFTNLQTSILKEKAEKFKNHCLKNVSVVDMLSKPTLRCLRRASHMLQATEFMMQYQRELLKNENAFLGDGHGAQQQRSAEKALEALTSALGEEGRHILMFRKKLMSDPVAIMKNSADSVRQMANVMYGLMSSNWTTKHQAQKFVEEMPTGKGHLTKEDVKMLKEAYKNAPQDLDGKDSKGDETWRVIEGFFLGNGRKANEARQLIQKETATADGASGLLQVDQMQATSLKFNLRDFIIALLWILFIASVIGTILIGAEVLKNLAPSLVWAILGTCWYSGIALAMEAVWRGLGSGGYGWKSQAHRADFEPSFSEEEGVTTYTEAELREINEEEGVTTYTEAELRETNEEEACSSYTTSVTCPSRCRWLSSACEAGCPASIFVSGAESTQPAKMGTYTLSSIAPSGDNGGRPIWSNARGQYMYYWAPYQQWAMGPDHTLPSAGLFGSDAAACPDEVASWSVWDRSDWSSKYSVTVAEAAGADYSEPGVDYTEPSDEADWGARKDDFKAFETSGDDEENIPIEEQIASQNGIQSFSMPQESVPVEEQSISQEGIHSVSIPNEINAAAQWIADSA